MPATLLVLHSAVAFVDAMRARAPDADVVGCETPAAAVNACCAVEPDCVIVAPGVSTEATRTLISSIRVEPSSVASVPIVVLSTATDEAARVEVLRAGADVVIRWPISTDELVSRLDAFVACARRLSETTASSSRRSAAARTPRAAIPIDLTRPSSGNIERTTVATLLAIIEAKQVSGRLSIGTSETARQRLVLEIVDGTVARGSGPGERLSGADTIDAALRWSTGHYEFTPVAKTLGDALAPDSEIVGAHATPRRVPEPKRATARSSIGWRAQADPQNNMSKPPPPPRRETLQSQPAIRGAGEDSRRKAPAVTVEAAKRRATLTGAEAMPPVRKASVAIAVANSPDVNGSNVNPSNAEQEEVSTRRPR